MHKKYASGGIVKSNYSLWERFCMGWPFRTWLGAVNFLFFQWFFCRLTRCITLQPHHNIRPLPMDRATVSYFFQWGVVPLTGWWTPYIWIRLETMEEWAFHMLRGKKK